MTDQIFSIGKNKKKESGHEEGKKFPTLVRILEGMEIVQVAAGYQITLFLISEGDVLEIGLWNKSEEPHLKHKISEPIVKIVADTYSLYAFSMERSKNPY